MSSYVMIFQVIDFVVSGGRPELNVKDTFKPYVSLMRNCWHTNPEERPSFKQVGVTPILLLVTVTVNF